MSFAESRKDNFYDVQLLHFGELVTFSREGQDDRQIKVRFRRTAADDEGQYIEQNVDTAEVRVGRDESHALGGIDAPRMRDKVTRANDPDGPYAWTGEVLKETPHSFLLRFTRPKLQRLGAKREQ